MDVKLIGGWLKCISYSRHIERRAMEYCWSINIGRQGHLGNFAFYTEIWWVISQRVMIVMKCRWNLPKQWMILPWIWIEVIDRFNEWGNSWYSGWEERIMWRIANEGILFSQRDISITGWWSYSRFACPMNTNEMSRKNQLLLAVHMR